MEIKTHDSKGNPRCITNSKGKKRRPGSRPLSTALNTDDLDFVDFIGRCLDWNSSLRMSPDEALQHIWLRSCSSQRISSQPFRDIESVLHEDIGCPEEYDDPLEDSGTFLPSIL
ncbi:dual specificity tyrosine-phosphorylation-regulated kinase 4 [Trichonephila clavipes]|nr:dual specificity tyrosine-phosphorylation-regulated kinase 4 [Trichonephila clavipes]